MKAPLRFGVQFTEAEGQALAQLAIGLKGAHARKPLITALNKVKAELRWARRTHGENPTGRVLARKVKDTCGVEG